MQTNGRAGTLCQHQEGQTLIDAIIAAADTYLQVNGRRPTTCHVPPEKIPAGCTLFQVFHQGRPISVIPNSTILEGHFLII